MNWFEEVERAQADGWAMPTSEQWKVLHEMGREHQQYMDTWAKFFEEAIDRTVIEWKGMIKHDYAEFTEDQWARAKVFDGEGITVEAYNEQEQDHMGPYYLSINMNDHFFYACAWTTRVPPERVDELLEACESGQGLRLDALAADIENRPPVNEIIKEMEECGYIPKETTDKYRRQMKEAGRENEKW